MFISVHFHFVPKAITSVQAIGISIQHLLADLDKIITSLMINFRKYTSYREGESQFFKKNPGYK